MPIEKRWVVKPQGDRQAVEALSVLPVSRERELLEELAYFTAKRVM